MNSNKKGEKANNGKGKKQWLFIASEVIAAVIFIIGIWYVTNTR